MNQNFSFCGVTKSFQTNANLLQTGITLSAPTLGFTFKNGRQDTLRLSLNKAPEANVDIPLLVSNVNQAFISPSKITFTSTNWNSPQTITVTGIDDTSYGVDSNFTVSYGPSISSDSSYNGLSGTSSSITNKDFRKLIFITNLTTQGNFGGISIADTLCNSSANKPANTGNYKALIAQPGIRVASVTADTGDGQIDWVLLPNQLYTRVTGIPIMTTNSASIYTTFPLTNIIGSIGEPIWT